MTAQLALTPTPEQPLTPAQKKFNQLLKKIEQARADLQAWDDHTPAFAQAHAQQVRPLQQELDTCRHTLVLRLDTMLSNPKGWTKKERATMRDLMCQLAADLIDSEFMDDEQAEALKALYDTHAEVDFESEQAQSLEEMKATIEAVTGLDLGDAPFDSPEDLLRHAQARMQAEGAQASAFTQPEDDGPATPRRRPTAAQRRREQEAQDATQSLREVYRKLASALHPDRASDDTDRERRTALMQRANQAYERQDLLALFALQLETEQVDMAKLARATSDRVSHFNRVLSEQLRQLQDELLMRAEHLRMTYMLPPGARLQPRKLNVLLAQEVRHWQAMLHSATLDLRWLDAPGTAKHWLRQQAQELKALDDMPFFF
ncbi:MAG: J domain-containing protein [Aquabacterium sp.]|jgi:hypothetical protein